jgi:hypothetical protein
MRLITGLQRIKIIVLVIVSSTLDMINFFKKYRTGN